VLLLSGLLLVLSSILGLGASAAPKANNGNGGGANQNCGAYCADPGAPSMNGNGGGNAGGKPCAGCVGNADNKNPPGQFKNAGDHNHGYESSCGIREKNNGIAKGNPAHSVGSCNGSTTTTQPCVDNDIIAGNAGDEAHIGKGKGHKDDPSCVTTTTSQVTTTTVPQTTTTVPRTTTTVPQTTTTVPQTTTTTGLVTTTTVPEETTTTVPQTTTTTSEVTTTTVPEETTTTVPEETTTTVPEATTTTAIPTNVLGERFVQPSSQVGSSTASQPLARTGSNVRTELFWAGLALALGGLAAMFGERKRAQQN
jgi:hypothetical protein